MTRCFRLLALAALLPCSARGWDYFQFDLPSQAPEAAWRDVLAEKLNARHEVGVEGGRVDVMTSNEVIELDWPHKWHEGLGQSLHYSDATGKKPVLALISYSQGPENLRARSIERFNMVEKYCGKHGVRLIVLFPTRPRAYGPEADRDAIYPPSTNFWLNIETGVRHRPGCRFYATTLSGRPCGEDEGKPCGICCPDE